MKRVLGREGTGGARTYKMYLGKESGRACKTGKDCYINSVIPHQEAGTHANTENEQRKQRKRAMF
eukprot:6175556-Pleurochrysis_carterae.AAC.1